jgi:CDGSH-type Zn-finger protein
MDRCTITPYLDGPLLVRGPFKLLDQQGNEIVVDRQTVALCRCGRSRIKPLCDGTHSEARFKATGGDERELKRAADEARANGRRRA